MKIKKSTITFKDLPETITPYDYADWRGIGENKAREIFNSKDFPRIKGTGVKGDSLQTVLQEIAKQII